ncbi:hypothetical protein H7198_06240 [Fructobacillus sp. CRL 2054]|uniref:GH25 family lysozyme n=1 Tax=Fructobacillus sp. CRL 2054 TaxID=2763007 RepID=UPI002379563F|nr:GH25 family lysozyme [Fructobacillus sp. CRL 2054]MDD9139201.1 hypothetical protein [Fructobacillus sp. CRL 2054]
MLKVADVSQYQGNDISGIANENDAIIVKATQSTGYVNPNFSAQVATAQSMGRQLGVYHFIERENNTDDTEQQAQHFLDTIGDLATNPDVALILDFENNAAYETLTGYEPRKFADYVQSKTGKKIWLYISNADIRGGGHGYTWSDMADYPVWVAGYPYSADTPVIYDEDLQNWANGAYFSNMPEWQDKVTMWQYSSNGYDKSVFYGDVELWKHLSAGGAVTPSEMPYVAPDNVKPEESAIDKFKEVGNRFILQGDFSIQTCQFINKMYQCQSEDLAADPFDWDDNGICTKLLTDVSDPVGRSFEDGATVAFLQRFNHGTIDEYNVSANTVGIDMGQEFGGMLWLDADKAWNHA